MHALQVTFALKAQKLTNQQPQDAQKALNAQLDHQMHQFVQQVLIKIKWVKTSVLPVQQGITVSITLQNSH